MRAVVFNADFRSRNRRAAQVGYRSQDIACGNLGAQEPAADSSISPSIEIRLKEKLVRPDGRRFLTA